MYPTTASYQSKIYADTIDTRSKIEFELVDVDAYLDAGAITVTSENTISRKSQTNNLIRDMPTKYLTWENNSLLLDGSFSLAPKTSESNFEVGWWSLEQSLEGGLFVTPQIFTKNFINPQQSIGLTITFDQQSNEYAEDFTIYVYDALNVLIDSEIVTGNALSKFVWSNNIDNYSKIVINITRWGNSFRYARILEIDFGIIKEYTDENIVSLSVLKEINTISDNLASDETSFILDNTSQEFNILNPVGIYPFLQKRQKIKPYYGLALDETNIEWIPMGVYYLTEWSSDQGSLTASFTARDLLDILQQQKYRRGKVQTITATNLLIEILSDFGLLSGDYVIDSALNSITLNGNIPILSYREAIQLVCNASRSVVYVDRAGILQIKQLTTTASVDTIDFGTVESIPQIQLEKRINTVEVSVNTYTDKISSENLFTGAVSIIGTKDVWIEYKTYPATTVSSVITGATSINSEIYYGNAGLINVTASGIVDIVTTGTVQEKAESLFTYTNKDDDEELISVKINNDAIGDTSTASNVAIWVYNELNNRFKTSINWLMNPAHDITDIIIAEDDFSENKTSRIVKNEFKYDGALNGTTTTLGGE